MFTAGRSSSNHLNLLRSTCCTVFETHRIVFHSTDSLICHCWTSSGVTNNINNSSALLYCASWQWASCSGTLKLRQLNFTHFPAVTCKPWKTFVKPCSGQCGCVPAVFDWHFILTLLSALLHLLRLRLMTDLLSLLGTFIIPASSSAHHQTNNRIRPYECARLLTRRMILRV